MSLLELMQGVGLKAVNSFSCNMKLKVSSNRMSNIARAGWYCFMLFLQTDTGLNS